jgi:outer membrane protein assembly factor BamB
MTDALRLNTVGSLKKRVIATLLISVMTLAACSGSKRRLAADLTPVTQNLELTRAWSINIGKSEPYSFHPVVVGDDLYTASANGLIYRVDAVNGKVVWSAKVGSDVSSGVGTDGRVVAIASPKGMVFAYDSNGGKLWQESVGSEVLSEPVVGGGVVVIRTIENRFIGLDALTGKRRWVYQRPQSALSLRTSYGMRPINNEVFLTGFSSGKFGIVALATGNLIWESSLSSPRGYSEIERLSDITAAPSLLGARMCAVSYQGKLGCGDIKSGNMAWTKDFSSYYGVAQASENVFAVNEKSYVTAFKANNGEEIWRNEKMVWRDLGEPLAVGKVLLTGDSQGYLHVLSQENGDLMARLKVDASRISAAPLAVGGVIVVQTRGGTLAAYRP